jgi:hypothetical protein
MIEILFFAAIISLVAGHEGLSVAFGLIAIATVIFTKEFGGRK